MAFVLFNVYQDQQHKQLVESFTPVITEAIEAEYDGQDTIEGLAFNDYIEPSSYKVSDISLTSITNNGDNVSGEATATFTNKSFESDATVQYTLQQTGENSMTLRGTLRYVAILGGVARSTRLPARTRCLLPHASALEASGDTWRY